MSSKNQELFNNFYSSLINTIKKSNISIIKFFGENSDYISINSFTSGCKKLGLKKKEEINTLANKFLKIDLNLIKSECNSYMKNPQKNTKKTEENNKTNSVKNKPNKNTKISFNNIRASNRFNEINKASNEKKIQIVQNWINNSNQKILNILKNHQRYSCFVLYYKIYEKFLNFKDEPKKFFFNKDPNKKLLLPKSIFLEALNTFDCKLTPNEFNLILLSLSSRTNDLYSYEEFLDNVYLILKIENGQLVQIFQECNFLFNDYLYNFRHFIIDNKINYNEAYIKVFNNMTLMPFDLFEKFLNEMNYSLPHEEEYKYLFCALNSNNYLWNSILINLNNYCSKKSLDDFIYFQEISEEKFIENGKLIKEKSLKGNSWKKNIKNLNNNKEYYLKKYEHLENMFKNIHLNCIKYNINNFIEYFEKSNENITNDGNISVEGFTLLLKNIGIGQNLAFESVLKLFGNENNQNYIKLADFLSVYLLFKNNNNNNLKQSNISQKLNSNKKDNFVFQNKFRKFTQDDIDHVCELCKFIADIIINEKKTSVNNYFKKIDNLKQGFISIKQLKKIFKDDLQIEVDNDDSMNDFFDIILFDEKMAGNFIAKIDRIIQIIKTYSGKD